VSEHYKGQGVGWIFLVVAVVQLVAGLVVLRRLRSGRVPAIVIAVLGMVRGSWLGRSCRSEAS
jgi:hypothetical protein